jgi:flagellin
MNHDQLDASLSGMRDTLLGISSLIMAADSRCPSRVAQLGKRAAMLICIASVAQAQEPQEPRRHEHGHFIVTDVAEGVHQIDVRRAHIEHNETLDIHIDIEQGAAPGALYLSMGGYALDLNGCRSGATSAFTIQIAGSFGSRAITFSSGTSLVDMAAAFRQLAGPLGVSANASGTGIRLESAGIGRSAFVSARVLHDGNINGYPLGIYTDDPQAGGLDFASSYNTSSTVRDGGRDMVATVNGEPAATHGTWLSVDGHSLELRMMLSDELAETPDDFRAFRLRRRPD